MEDTFKENRRAINQYVAASAKDSFNLRELEAGASEILGRECGRPDLYQSIVNYLDELCQVGALRRQNDVYFR